jgi:UDP-glucose 4-epimerase
LRVVVFGGAGFVGLNIAEALRERGDEAVLFDRSPPPVEGFEFIRGDVREKLDVIEKADCVIWGATITADATRDAAEPELIVETTCRPWSRCCAVRATPVRGA